MEKNQGVTLIELLVGMAILVIITLMAGRMTQNASRANQSQVLVNRIDMSLGKSVDIIKRTVRGAKSNSDITELTSSGIYVANETTVYINIPVEEEKLGKTNYTNTLVKYALVGNYLKVGSVTSGALVVGSVSLNQPSKMDKLAKNISEVKFRYEDNIFTVYLKVNVKSGNKEFSREISDAAVSAIDFNF